MQESYVELIHTEYLLEVYQKNRNEAFKNHKLQRLVVNLLGALRQEWDVNFELRSLTWIAGIVIGEVIL